MLTKDQAIKKYQLESLTGEGGYFRRIYESDETNSEGRRFTASIYYLLEAPDFSCFHRIDCDEIWHFLGGAELMLYQLLPNGQLVEIIMGDALSEQDVTPFALIKKGTWFAAEIKDKHGCAVLGCTTIPEFKYETFEAASCKELTSKFPQHGDLIKRMTRS